MGQKPQRESRAVQRPDCRAESVGSARNNTVEVIVRKDPVEQLAGILADANKRGITMILRKWSDFGIHGMDQVDEAVRRLKERGLDVKWTDKTITLSKKE